MPVKADKGNFRHVGISTVTLGGQIYCHGGGAQIPAAEHYFEGLTLRGSDFTVEEYRIVNDILNAAARKKLIDAEGRCIEDENGDLVIP